MNLKENIRGAYFDDGRVAEEVNYNKVQNIRLVMTVLITSTSLSPGLMQQKYIHDYFFNLLSNYFLPPIGHLVFNANKIPESRAW